MAMAASMLDESAVAIVKDGRVLARKSGNGIRPLLEAIRGAGDVAGAALADRVVGVAVAKLALLFEFGAVHARLVSEPAKSILESSGIGLSYDKLAVKILNRKKDGPCPIESMALGPVTPRELYVKLSEMLFPVARTDSPNHRG